MELSELEHTITSGSGMVPYDDKNRPALESRYSRSILIRIIQFISQNVTTETNVVCINVPIKILEIVDYYFPGLNFIVWTHSDEKSDKVEVLQNSKGRLSRTAVKAHLATLKGGFVLFSNYTGNRGEEKNPDTITKVNKLHMSLLSTLYKKFGEIKCTFRFKLVYDSPLSETECLKGVYYWLAWSASMGNMTFVEPQYTDEGPERSTILNEEYDKLCSYQNQVVRASKKYKTPKGFPIRPKSYDAALETIILKQYLGKYGTDSNIVKLSEEIKGRLK
uniref:Uncharacterized protein n=1 Tax=viral metagenome TaxID=1070528 RepID=A0A6C0JTA2_9ZZZZ